MESTRSRNRYALGWQPIDVLGEIQPIYDEVSEQSGASEKPVG